MKKLITNVAKGLSDNSPAILTGMAVCGVFGTVVLAVKATPKALELIDEDPKKGLTAKEIVQVAWKPYIPAAVMGTVTIACIIGSNQISSRRNAALVSLYSLAEAGLKEYQTKVVETIGEGKERKIRDEISKDRITENPPVNHVIIGTGENLCYDSISGRYFKSSVEEIRQKINSFNHDLIYNMSSTLNELYYELGLEPIGMGNEVGYTPDELVEIDFSSQLTADDKPCVVVNFTLPTAIR